MHPAFSVDQVNCSEDAGAKDGPNLFFCKWPLLFNASVHFCFKGIVNILEDEDDFVEGGAERIFRLSGEMLKV